MLETHQHQGNERTCELTLNALGAKAAAEATREAARINFMFTIYLLRFPRVSQNNMTFQRLLSIINNSMNYIPPYVDGQSLSFPQKICCNL